MLDRKEYEVAEFKDANLQDVLIIHIEAIANALCGEDASAGGGDRLRHAIGRIADYFSNNPVGSYLPAVAAADNGKVLKVVNGAWAVAEDSDTEAELPAVTADDNGKVLKVVEGSWDAAE